MSQPFKLKPFNDRLFEDLRDPEFAEAYLQDAWEDTTEEFLIALRKYVQANGGLDRCAEAADVAPEALGRMLSRTGNPDLRSVRAVLEANGIRFSIVRSSGRSPELAAA